MSGRDCKMIGRFFGKKKQRPQNCEAPVEIPFGERIANPDSLTMPLEFHGAWVRDPNDCDADGSPTRTVISSDCLVINEVVQRVVAVRFIETGKVSVVTLSGESAQQQYSLYYFGLSEDGNSLIDLESTDWVLYRCQAQTG